MCNYYYYYYYTTPQTALAHHELQELLRVSQSARQATEAVKARRVSFPKRFGTGSGLLCASPEDGADREPSSSSSFLLPPNVATKQQQINHLKQEFNIIITPQKNGSSSAGLAYHNWNSCFFSLSQFNELN
jgi:hypothetical protein